jgi:hypothetical protein
VKNCLDKYGKVGISRGNQARDARLDSSERPTSRGWQRLLKSKRLGAKPPETGLATLPW